MKKKYLYLFSSICIAMLFAINISVSLTKDSTKNGLALKNIEALAEGEGPNEEPRTKDAYANSYYDANGGYVRVKSDSPCWCIGYYQRQPIGRVVCQCTN